MNLCQNNVRIVLVSCCAPCSCGAIAQLKEWRDKCPSCDCLTPLAGGVPTKWARGVNRGTESAQSFAKTLRKKMTMYECLLWRNLSKSPSGFSFRKQHPIGKYIVDFINLENRLIIELDGNGHGEDKQIRHDAQRDKFLTDSGYRVIRFWNSQVYKKMQMVLDTIYHYLTHDDIPKLQDFYPKEIISPPSALRATPPASGVRQSQDDIQSHISDFIVLFFNPNIYPESEYQKRLGEQVRYCESIGVKYHIGDYDHKAWLADVASLESEPERGARCAACFRHRFKYAREFAIKNGYNAIASVLGVSRHKNQAQVDATALEVVKFPPPLAGGGNPSGMEIKYIPIKWNEELRQKINRESDFYRQNYCGCEFSIKADS